MTLTYLTHAKNSLPPPVLGRRKGNIMAQPTGSVPPTGEDGVLPHASQFSATNQGSQADLVGAQGPHLKRRQIVNATLSHSPKRRRQQPGIASQHRS